MATEEIERLNRVLKDRNTELRDLQSRLFDSETKTRSLESDFARIKTKLDSEFKLRE